MACSKGGGGRRRGGMGPIGFERASKSTEKRSLGGEATQNPTHGPDSDLAEVVELWSKLTRAQRAAVLAMVRTMAD